MRPGLKPGGDASVWRQIRAARSSPPGFAGLDDERRQTFGAVRLGDVLASIPEVSSTAPVLQPCQVLLLRRQRSRGQEFWGGPEVDSTRISVGWSMPS